MSSKPRSSASRKAASTARLTVAQQKRRANIVEAALTLALRSKGNVEMRDVCRKSGVALGTLYRYFESKELLYAEVFQTWVSRYMTTLSVPSRTRRSGAERIRDILHHSVDVFAEHPQFWDMAMMARSLRNPIVHAQRLAAEERTWRLFKDAITGRDEKDADAIARILQGVFYLFMMHWRAGDMTVEDVHRVLDETIRVTLDDRDDKGNSGAISRNASRGERAKPLLSASET